MWVNEIFTNIHKMNNACVDSFHKMIDLVYNVQAKFLLNVSKEKSWIWKKNCSSIAPTSPEFQQLFSPTVIFLKN